MRLGTESGASSVEYGLVVFAIAAVIALIVFTLGQVVRSSYTDSCQTVAAAVTASSAC